VEVGLAGRNGENGAEVEDACCHGEEVERHDDVDDNMMVCGVRSVGSFGEGSDDVGE